jgi:hypothetical protein
MRLAQVLIALDQLANAICGGWADETLSSRAYRESPRAEKFINTLFFWDKDHCYESYVSEQLRTQLPPELRK